MRFLKAGALLLCAFLFAVDALWWSGEGSSDNDDENDLESDTEISSGSEVTSEGSAHVPYIVGATSLEIEENEFMIDKLPEEVSEITTTTIRSTTSTSTAEPQKCEEGSCASHLPTGKDVTDGDDHEPCNGTDCESDKGNNYSKGDHALCEQALSEIQTASVVLRKINEQGIESFRGVKGSKGDRGERGYPGSTIFKGEKGERGLSIKGDKGPWGPPGPPGIPGMKGDKGPKGDTGVQGPSGTPGVSIPGEKGEKGDCEMRQVRGYPGPKGPPGNGILQFRTMDELAKMEKFTLPGAIAYVEEKGRFYGRVPKGWATLLMQLGDTVYRPRKPDPSLHSTRRPKWDAFGRRQRVRGSYRVGRSEVSNDRPETPRPVINWNSEEPSNLRLIALNEPYDGNMHGIDNINFQCQKQAMNEGIDGVFRAFLSTWEVNLKDLVRNQKDTIVNLYNKTLFSSWSDVFTTSKNVFHSQTVYAENSLSSLYSFSGKNVILDADWDLNLIWHGAHIKGKSSRRNCNNWTTNETTSVGIASDFLYKYMLHQQDEMCNNKLIVLCIELPANFVFQYFVHKNKIRDESLLQEQTKPIESTLQISFDDYNKCLRDYYGY